MDSYLSSARFKFSWRPYQKRVLDELGTHLADDRLHVVAPPGSGKTVLGLEIMRRIGKPAMALAPSLAIRNQWVERFTELFLQLDRPPSWISTDIDEPAYLTVTTYQSIHSIFNFRKNQEKKQARATAVLNALTGLETHTLIVDEAHHLQKEWWKSLDRLRGGIGEHTVVALTATPPYDVSGSEWERYIELCGPIDAEICIPEMMLEEGLCPHQDFIYFSPPTEGSQKQIDQFYANVDKFSEEIKSNVSFTLFLQDTPALAALAAMDAIPPGNKEEAEKFIKECKDNYNAALKEIAGNPEFYFSLLVYLNDVLPEPEVYLCRVLEVAPHDIPPLDKIWLQALLSSCIYDRFDLYTEEEQEILIQIRRKLRRIGAIENKRVNLEFTDDLDQLLQRDPNKLHSIVHIVEEEATSQREQDLRVVILCDRIYHDLFPEPGQTIRQEKLGVVPVFELLREKGPESLRLGILCGTLVVLPANCATELEVVAGSRYGMSLADLKMKQLPHDRGYFIIDCNDQNRQHIVAIVTELFRIGEVTALVGTRALLGEGWDAPVINTLILANNVGSHVSSNQMRGRALRTVPNNADKVSNIWHIASISTAGDPGPDIERLTARFKTYMGLGLTEPIIENGLERMGIQSSYQNALQVQNKNRAMIEASKDRHTLAERWQSALKADNILERYGKKIPQKRDELVLPDTLIPGYVEKKFFSFSQAEKLSFWALTYVFIFPSLFLWFPSAYQLITGIGIVPLFWLLKDPQTSFKSNKKNPGQLKEAAGEEELQNIGRALISTLIDIGILNNSFSKNKLPIYLKDGNYYLSVENATTQDETTVIEAFAEMYDSIKDPRYVLVRQIPLVERGKIYIHPVPALLGKNKKNAECFEKRWRQYVGKADVLYTKSIDGMKAVLKARGQSLLRKKQRSKRISRWK